jgi:hypothetical protein
MAFPRVTPLVDLAPALSGGENDFRQDAVGIFSVNDEMVSWVKPDVSPFYPLKVEWNERSPLL